MQEPKKQEKPPQFFGGETEPAEAYRKAADCLEAHPAYRERSEDAPDGEATLEQYVDECRSRAEMNFEDEPSEEAQQLFEKYWALLQ